MSDPAIQIITDLHEPLVIIYHDGSLTYGKTYTPDMAAKMFFKALADQFHEMMEARFSAGFEAGYESGKRTGKFDG